MRECEVMFQGLKLRLTDASVLVMLEGNGDIIAYT